MKVPPRLVLPLAGAAVLAVVVLGVVLWPSPSAPPSPEAAPPRSVPVATVTPEHQPRVAPSRPPEAVSSSSAPSVAAPEAPERATVVPVGPGDEVPLPESPNPLPQVNDPILPEKPQTARWKLGKTQRITELLARDVERLERERDAAGTRGDTAEHQRLETELQRHRQRLVNLGQEIQELSRQAENEPPER
jgi:hypothetical protein